MMYTDILSAFVCLLCTLKLAEEVQRWFLHSHPAGYQIVSPVRGCHKVPPTLPVNNVYTTMLSKKTVSSIHSFKGTLSQTSCVSYRHLE